jgi:hypothetical protein
MVTKKVAVPPADKVTLDVLRETTGPVGDTVPFNVTVPDSPLMLVTVMVELTFEFCCVMA